MKYLTKKKTLTKSFEKIVKTELERMGSASYQRITDLAGLCSSTNIVAGDVVGWFEPVFSGSYRNATLEGYKFAWGKVVRDSYSARGQHTFTIADKMNEEHKIRRKGRSLFNVGAFILHSGEDRSDALNEKYVRGKKAKIAALESWLAVNTDDHPAYDQKRQRLESLGGF